MFPFHQQGPIPVHPLLALSLLALSPSTLGASSETSGRTSLLAGTSVLLLAAHSWGPQLRQCLILTKNPPLPGVLAPREVS